MKTFTSLLILVVACSAQAKSPRAAKPDLGSVLGKTVILCRDTELWVPVQIPDGKLDWNGTKAHAPFTAAKITKAEIHSETHSGDWGSYSLAFLVTLPDDKQGILLGELNQIYADQRGKGLLRNAFQSAVALGDLFLDLPNGLKEGDVVTLHRGMRDTTARCLLGRPDADNDYGSAGDQLVFNGGRLILYIDPTSHRITDIQQPDVP